MSFLTRRRVEFRDTDAAGIVHFSAFFPWMEAAEHEMLRSVGIKIIPDFHDAVDQVTWPRVSASCEYQKSARFEDWIIIEVSVAKIGRSSVHYDVLFSRESDLGTLTKIAIGKTVVVCCQLKSGGHLQKVDIPRDVRVKLESL